jgi:peroxiredoxin Q/BCP
MPDVRIPDAGGTAPDFTLPDSTGTPRRLSELVADRPLVLIFYRGSW